MSLRDVRKRNDSSILVDAFEMFRKCAAIMANGSALLSLKVHAERWANPSTDQDLTFDVTERHTINSPTVFNSRSCIRKKSFTSSDTTGEVLVPAVNSSAVLHAVFSAQMVSGECHRPTKSG